MPTPIRLLTAADVRAALPMPAAIAAMRRAFGQLSAGEAEMPLRARVQTPDGVTLVMPAYLRQSQELAVKIVSVFGGNPARGLPAVPATVLVMDPATGLPRALIEGAALTAIRTGAGGGLAAELLARPDAHRVAVFGAGPQAHTQLQGVLAVRPVTEVFVISRRHATAERFAAEIAAWAPALRVHTGVAAAEAVRAADLVITATASATPVFDGHALRPGTHVTAVGAYTPAMQEVDAVTIARADWIVVDSREAALAEAGDLIIPNARIDAELGEIVNGRQPGRPSAEAITLFKSVGVAAQDAAAAGEVLSAAEALGLGTVVSL